MCSVPSCRHSILHSAFCTLHSALCDSPPNSPFSALTHLSVRITYLVLLYSLGLINPPIQHTLPNIHPPIHLKSYTPTPTPRHSASSLTRPHTLTPSAHTPTLAQRPRPVIYGTTPDPTACACAVQYSTHSVARGFVPTPSICSPCELHNTPKKRHGSIAFLTPRRQPDNDER